ncbi:hypothetical protein BX666DRAFT_2032250 [Dichotomocladium elegans]|nr:hypothetical protein BX666DRAFT_2032250 [Dichotomocladium elegans]
MEDNDPYRAARKPNTDHGNSLGRKEVKLHSRTASESSTTNLTTRDYFYNEDPYARHEDKRQPLPNYRANSYLPYSHHRRDPNTPVTPIFIEDVTISNQDRTISLQVHSTHNTNAHESPNPLTSKTHSLLFSKSRRRRRRRRQQHADSRLRWCCCYCCCGESSLPIRHWRLFTFLGVLFLAALALVWFFCWPRVPELSLDGLDDLSSSQNSTFMNTGSAGSGSVVFNTTWSLNLTIDNSQNWIPTHIDNMSVRVLSSTTNAQIGKGSSSSFIIKPRMSKQLAIISLSMHYEAATEDDDTIKDLYSTCYTQNKDATASSLLSILAVDFLVDIKTHGLAWTNTVKVLTPSGVPCPT